MRRSAYLRAQKLYQTEGRPTTKPRHKFKAWTVDDLSASILRWLFDRGVFILIPSHLRIRFNAEGDVFTKAMMQLTRQGFVSKWRSGRSTKFSVDRAKVALHVTQ